VGRRHLHHTAHLAQRQEFVPLGERDRDLGDQRLVHVLDREVPAVRDAELLAQCQSMIERIDGTLDTVRRIATELRPSVLDQLGLEAALEWQSQEFSTRTGILVDLDIAMGGATIPEHMASSSFRILQESLTNVARHARASRVAIRLAVVEGELTLEITDDGIGIAPQRMDGTASLGLVGMRERALAAGGELCISGRPTLGTTVLLKVPLHHPSAA
jgi:signal transduction histidine kinase